MTAMQTLTQLVELKRAATTTEALDRYAAALIHATTTWTGTTAQIHTSTLSIDALIDRIAHEATENAPQGRQEPSQTPEQGHVGLPSQPCPPRALQEPPG